MLQGGQEQCAFLLFSGLSCLIGSSSSSWLCVGASFAFLPLRGGASFLICWFDSVLPPFTKLFRSSHGHYTWSNIIYGTFNWVDDLMAFSNSVDGALTLRSGHFELQFMAQWLMASLSQLRASCPQVHFIGSIQGRVGCQKKDWGCFGGAYRGVSFARGFLGKPLVFLSFLLFLGFCGFVFGSALVFLLFSGGNVTSILFGIPCPGLLAETLHFA